MKNEAYCMMKSLQKPRKKPLQCHSRSSHSSDCMNKVILMGRLTRDPDIRVSNIADRQITVARYTLAVDRRAKRDGNDQPADFISCL